MADGKIEYELSIDARAGIASVTSADAAARGLATSADRAATSADRAGKALGNISGEKIKTAATMIGLAAVDIGAAYMRVNGMTSQAGYLQSAATGALSMGGLGAMALGPYGAAGGAVIGAGAGLGKEYFSQQEKQAAEAKQLETALMGVHLNAELAVRSISRMDAPEQLEKTLEDIADKVYAIGYQASAGLIGKDLAAVQIRELERVAQAAQDALPGARAKKADDGMKEVSGGGAERSNRLTAMGGMLADSSGGMASAANDAARGTMDNTRRMVTLLERIERAGNEGGGSVWQP